MRKLIGPAFASFALSTSMWAQSTWYVDDDGPADFVTVQDAVDASSSGDTVIVRPGGYGVVRIDGKGLVLVSDGTDNQLAFELEAIRIVNVSAGQSVVLRGFLVQAGADTPGNAVLEVHDNDGLVHIEDCQFLGMPSEECQEYEACPPESLVYDAVIASACEELMFVRCNLIGRVAYSSLFVTPDVGAGLQVSDSSVFLFDCQIHGAKPQCVDLPLVGECVFVTNTGVGVHMTDSELFLSGCNVSGGSGWFDPPGGLNGKGRPAIYSLDGQGFVVVIASILTHGKDWGSESPDPVVQGITPIELAGEARTHLGSLGAQPLGSYQLVAAGAPGDLVFVLYTVDPVPAFPVCGAPLYWSATPFLQPLGVLPLAAPHVIVAEKSAPPLGHTMHALTLFSQSVFFDANGECYLAAPSALTVAN